MAALPDSSPYRIVRQAEEALEHLTNLYENAAQALQTALAHFLETGQPPSPGLRAQFRYPELRVTCSHSTSSRGHKYIGAGVYTTTITQPKAFQAYLLDQLNFLLREENVQIEVGVSNQEIPYPYLPYPLPKVSISSGLEGGGLESVQAVVPQLRAGLGRFFPSPLLSLVDDDIANGTFLESPSKDRPLALFDALRVDYSLRRLLHYTGTEWFHCQPWILLTNYHRYADQFVRWGLQQLQESKEFSQLVLPGNLILHKGMAPQETEQVLANHDWHRFQMPAYHLISEDSCGKSPDRKPTGITLVNIGVGPSNAKTITDHLAVLRPHCWLMVGHCAGLRHSQQIGDYVLAHAYLRQDHILDDYVSLSVPIPALAEVQVALQQAAQHVTGHAGDQLKQRLRTGTIVTNDDRNWELNWRHARRIINQSRAVAVDMEAGTIATQGFRFRVPYGTLLCVSDKPLHGEIKLPNTAISFYERSISEHLQIGLAALRILQNHKDSLHSRKLRSFDEPLFR